MNAAAIRPGLGISFAQTQAEPSPIRSDVAGFAGHTERGPVGVPVRVEGWLAFNRIFGGFQREANTPYALRGYFDNGGEVAYVIRLAHQPQTARGQWQLGNGANQPVLGLQAGFRSSAYWVQASSAGAWANDTKISLHYVAQGFANLPELDVYIHALTEAPVQYAGLKPESFQEQLLAQSALVEFLPRELAGLAWANSTGPRSFTWELRLEGGTDGDRLSVADYLDAVIKLGDLGEVALVALPDLHRDFPEEDGGALEVLAALARQAELLHDRLILLDLPTGREDAAATVDWLQSKLQTPTDFSDALKNLAVYHPHLQVSDPLGSLTQPLRSVPPSGHVAGVISRLDRERGAHYTPANASLYEAVDVTQGFAEKDWGKLHLGGVNLLRCFPGYGLQVYGGRTLEADPGGRYIAHRRLIHRLVRAIRRVAEPLVFDVNGPELWLTLVRAVTTVLAQAYAAGGLKGNRPDEAFRVKCDETNNPSESRDVGMVFCEIQIAPAVPMEFILLRISLSQAGVLEVFEQ